MLNDLSQSASAAALACTPDAIPGDLLQRWMQTGTQVYAAIEEVQELADGYACRLPSDATTLGMVAEYVGLDRLCCPFVRWTLEIEPYSGPLWLGIKGGEDVKALIRESFETTALLRESVARAAGLSVSGRGVWVHPSDPTLTTPPPTSP